LPSPESGAQAKIEQTYSGECSERVAGAVRLAPGS